MKDILERDEVAFRKYVEKAQKLSNECTKLRRRLLDNSITVESLVGYKDTIFTPLLEILDDDSLFITKELYVDFIYLCLDYYSYTADILISDYDYDQVMYHFISKGGEHITRADALNLSTWNLIPHEEPGVVGSIGKVYTKDELMKYWRKYAHIYEYILGPKYDGISAAVKVVGGVIVKACTRYDGILGQDITDVVIRAHNADSFMNEIQDSTPDGFYKVELCVGTTEFEQLIKEKEYANRRSATSGIVNSPKNLHLAKYVTIIPLAKFTKDRFIYSPRGYVRINRIGSAECLYDKIQEVLEIIRSADFEYRTDGVVVMPVLDSFNTSDLMSDGIAFKVNTKKGYTRIKNLYVSVGRTGKACPKAEVYPVECNETRVSDVSLGSFDKMLSMDLKEDETVIIYSAGDVIPQLMLPEIRQYPKHARSIHVDLRCPYCKERLRSVGREMYCLNEDCIRKLTGKITNFVQKIGMENISDSTIEDLFDAGLIKDIPDLFKLNADDIMNLDGYGETSAINIVDEIARVCRTPITVDVLFGALGIPDVAETTARKIFSVIDLKDLYKKKSKLFLKVQGADGIGDKIANNFCEYVDNNIDMIEELLALFEVSDVPCYVGNIAVSGFRNEGVAAKFRSIGYDVIDGINSNTVALIVNSNDRTSTKCQKALKRGIDIYHVTEIDDLYKILKRR